MMNENCDQFYKNLFKLNKEIMLLIKPETSQIIDCNQAACSFYGYSQEEMQNLKITDLNTLSEELITKEMNQAKIEKRNYFYFKHRLSNGQIRDVDVKSTPVNIDGQELLFSIITDTTNIRKQSELVKIENDYLERIVIERTYEIEEERNNLLINKNRLQAAQSIGHIGDFEVDLNSFIINWASDEFYRILGIEDHKEETTIRTMWNIVTREYRHVLIENLEKLLKEDKKVDLQIQIKRTNDKEKRNLQLKAEVKKDENNLPVKVFGIIQDITKTKEVEEVLKISEELYRTIFNQSPFGISLIDSITGRIYEANKKYLDIVEISLDGNMIVDWMSLTHPDDIQEDIKNMELMNKGEIDGFSMIKRYIFPDRPAKWVNMTIVPISIKSEKSKRHLCIIEDINERMKFLEDITYVSEHDSLTGLYNRRFFDEEFNRQVEKKLFPIAVILGGINGLKLYNDTYGHLEGDKELIRIGNKTKEFLNSCGICTRYGGDELAILINSRSEEYVKELTRNLEDYVNYSDNYLNNNSLTISFGYSIQRNKDDSQDDLLKEAEAFMNSKKYYNIKSSKSNRIDIIMNTLFEKSIRERDHSERVGRISEAIAIKMNYDEKSVNRIRVSGLLHDIGKIGIDEGILNKKGNLSNSEWEIMKLHTVKGARILDHTIEFREISNIVLSHHERYDGSGYPNGLKGDEIPIEARIITVADAYDAMTEERTYKNLLSHEEAIMELYKYSGIQFDPEIVDVFVKCFKAED